MTDELKQWEYDRGYEKGRADAIDEVCKQISERVVYWEQCANAVEKESNEYKIFVSLQKNFSDLAEQMQKGAENEN